MELISLVFSCHFFILHRVLCGDNFVKWVRHNTTDVSYGTSLPVEDAQSTSQCLARCTTSEGCESVNVQPDILQCELSTHYPTEEGLAQNQRPRWNVYFRESRNCKDIMDRGDATTGFKTIVPDGINPVRVLCVMTEDGGGWTVIQKRESATDFYQNWEKYRNGFGDDTNFWLGLENIHHLTAQGNYELRVDMKRTDSSLAAAKYGTFSVGNEAMLYKLSIGYYNFDLAFDDPRESFLWHNGMKFTTYDNDNDGWSSGNCAVDRKGGYWYNDCHNNNLNGVYGSTAPKKGINWVSWTGYEESLKYTRMMIRPNRNY